MTRQELTRLQYQWHHDVHRTWGGEHLHFWRLSFHAGFDADIIQAVLTEVLEEAEVKSYAAREMIGTVDLILRTWLPMRVAAPDFQELLLERLQVVNVGLIDSFDVADVKYQWSWVRGAPRRLRDFDLLVDAEESQLVSEGQTGDASALEQSGLLVRTGRDQGITFVMAIEGEVERLEAAERRRLSDLLAQVCESSEKIAELVLYAGSGFAAYLLVGRVDGNQINEVSKLGSEVMRLTREGGFPIKTTTMMSHPLEVLLYSEVLPESAELPASSASNLEDMLRLGEDALTDIRAAVFTSGGDAASSQAGQTDFAAATSFLKTVASFLNSRGGVVILGAIPVDEWEAERNAGDDVPVVGGYACVGLEPDLGDSSWDDYERRLEKLLEVHLEPDPMEWIDIKREYFGGRLMVTVRVEEADEGYFFFFVGGPSQSSETFFVRRGNTTIELSRSDADAYQRIENATGRLNASDWSIVRTLREQRRLDRFQLASSVGMSASEIDRALQRLIAGGYVTESLGVDDVSRFELDPHWSEAGGTPQRQKGSAS